MRTWRLYLLFGGVLLIVGLAAFLAGRMFNRGAVLVQREGDAITILPAEGIPDVPPAVEGLLVDRQDTIIIVEADLAGENPAAGSPVGVGGGPQEEVLVTSETRIYHDTTQPPSRPPSGDDPRTLQQTVEISTLDDLSVSHSLVMVWGRQTGDRIIAETVLYRNPVTIQQP